ncbi:hypothetical protein KsCSTR_15160 [Candidatus Kuenenia stuttgartiensis]|uniref:Uncharacterized protein n=1 Tax=Kuenenia stuttgartiensis TaxID=174633 RepID=Q1Q1J2_KUEST|nr:hypothetical protein KsCSTR_15160 [Candidatus Kuenenia stuttgartiensis]CAJ73869.1 unknown protein [Candidatus Kuenenia stuttgartiensis]
MPKSHHVSFATPRNDENGFITRSCCSICTQAIFCSLTFESETSGISVSVPVQMYRAIQKVSACHYCMGVSACHCEGLFRSNQYTTRYFVT